MSPLPRLIPPEGALHVITRGNNKRDIFHRNQDKATYCRFIKKYKEENNIKIFHYCLMNNHVHLIAWVTFNSDLSRFVQQVNIAYGKYYKRVYDYSGHLLQGRFRSNIIQNDAYLLQCGKYVELNPVRAKIVAKPDDYDFSSYRYYAANKNISLISTSPAYLGLSECPQKRRDAYKHFVINEQMINHERLSTHPLIGTAEYIKEMLQQISSVRQNLASQS